MNTTDSIAIKFIEVTIHIKNTPDITAIMDTTDTTVIMDTPDITVIMDTPDITAIMDTTDTTVIEAIICIPHITVSRLSRISQ
jgi:hypothetical protein